MYRRSLTLFGLILLSIPFSSALAADISAVTEGIQTIQNFTAAKSRAQDIKTDVAEWEPAIGDTFVVDVGTNTGYLVHEDGRSLSFPVATGRKEYVHYIGRYYKANTPIRTWTAEQKQIKGDRRTFGVSGRFIRLFRDGENSPYGIHSYFKVADWMQEDERYFSMGCVVVTEEIMDVIEKTFDVNEKKLTVITTDDPQKSLEEIAARESKLRGEARS